MRETDLLDLYIAQEMRKPFAWGQDNGDCLLFVAGWGLALNGIDFAANLRGRYSDEAGARRAIEGEGGPVAFFDRVAGARRDPENCTRGDVGLMPFGDWYLGAICTGARWVLRGGSGGIRNIRRPPEFAWEPNSARKATNAQPI
jgi:hypothetical protein